MTALDPNPAARRLLPLLLLLFIGSGCSALIYEIVWFQLLQFVIGSTAISLAVLLGTYMGGMCLGSILLPRFISTRQHPLRVYALLELGIGVCGVAVYYGMPLLDELYAANALTGYGSLVMRGIVCAVCLLPPTLLMGATLPAISRWVEATPAGVSWLGFFYGGNIAGAVFGCLLAGFYLLRRHDASTATFAAALLNWGVAAVGLGLAALTPYAAPVDAPTLTRSPRAPDAWTVYLAIGLSGMGALAAEVVWTRLLSLMLGATVYTFAIILAVFLVGLGLGSSGGAFVARTSTRPRLALGICQLLLAAAVAWSAFQLAESLPYWPVDPYLSRSPWYDFQLDLLRCLWAVLPASILWGASFPLALAGVARPGQDAGRMVGGVYAANTAGAILGALGTSLFLIPLAGTQIAQQVLIGLSAATGVVVLTPLFGPFRGRVEKPEGWLVSQVAGGGALSVGMVLAAMLVGHVPPLPGELVAWGRLVPNRRNWADVYYVGEGMNSSVAVSMVYHRDDVPTRNFHVAGKIEASTLPEDMRLQRMLGHLPALIHPKPQKVLVVGCGAGVTAGSFMTYPSVDRVVICEIEPLVPRIVAKNFAAENYGVVDDPRVEVVFDDARHYIRTTPEKFDIITSDPIHPWVKGAASLYTKEYFELVRRRLNPGGVVTQWVPLYESDEATVKSEIATFFEVFPNGTVWSNNVGGDGYDVVLLGQVEPPHIDLDELDQRLARDDHARVVQSLKDVHFASADDLLLTFATRAADLTKWTEDAQINRDRNLRLQYLAGMGLNAGVGLDYRLDTFIYDQIAAHRRFTDMFGGTEPRREELRSRMHIPRKSEP